MMSFKLWKLGHEGFIFFMNFILSDGFHHFKVNEHCGPAGFIMDLKFLRGFFL